MSKPKEMGNVLPPNIMGDDEENGERKTRRTNSIFGGDSKPKV